MIGGGDAAGHGAARGSRASVELAPERVLVHDAARPLVSAAVIDRVLGALDRFPAVLPVLPVVDTLKRVDDAAVVGRGRRAPASPGRRRRRGSASRRSWRRTARPRPGLHRRHGGRGRGRARGGLGRRRGEQPEADAARGPGRGRAAPGRARRAGAPASASTSMPSPRTGRWSCAACRCRTSWGSPAIPTPTSRSTRSPTRILGTIGAGDIGSHFPPSDPQWRDADSARFLRHAAALLAAAGRADRERRPGDRLRAAEDRAASRGHDGAAGRGAGLGRDQVSVKATTSERLGFTGRGEGIAAQAVVSVALAG